MRYSPWVFSILIVSVLLSMALPYVFADNTYAVTITVQGLPANVVTNLYVDGNFNGTVAGGASVTYALSNESGPYIFTVDSYVPGSNNGTRYYCQNTTWQANSTGSQVFTYSAQYFFNVQTPYSSATGQGWYTSGSTAHATVKDQQLPEGEGTRNIFSGWSGDATGNQLISNGVTMDGPKVATANWTTQFYLSIDSDPQNVTGLSGSGWYTAGAMANFSALMNLPLTNNTRLTFDHWSGEFNGQEPEGSISMDRPKTVQANYLPQYLLTVLYSSVDIVSSYNETHAGWYDENSEVQLGPVPTVINLGPSERLQFVGWSDNNSTSNNLSYSVLVDEPRNVTLTYAAQYYINVQSAYGMTSGSGWYAKGATATINAPTSSGTWPISYTLTGWTVNPPTQAVNNDGDSWTLLVNAPYVVQAQWSINYFPLILVFVGATIGVTGALSVGVGYKRGLFSRKHAAVRPTKAQASSSTTSVAAPSVPTQASAEEERVYDYIVNHQGVISLSAASKDLGLPVGRLKEIAERLKTEGRLT